MRLQVFVSHSGYCSRRKALDLVKQGLVKVNGKVESEPSYDVDIERDKVFIAGDRIALQPFVYLMLNKPRGYTTTVQDRHAEHTVMELVPRDLSHLYPVGRLDKESEGLLLLTNDGELAHRLMHPRYKIAKKYEVEVRGSVSDSQANRLSKGVVIDGYRTLPAKVRLVQIGFDWSRLEMTIKEGKKRQIRRMLEAVGHEVVSLRRTAYSDLELGQLTSGEFRKLKGTEVTMLQEAVGMKDSNDQD